MNDQKTRDSFLSLSFYFHLSIWHGLVVNLRMPPKHPSPEFRQGRLDDCAVTVHQCIVVPKLRWVEIALLWSPKEHDGLGGD